MLSVGVWQCVCHERDGARVSLVHEGNDLAFLSHFWVADPVGLSAPKTPADDLTRTVVGVRDSSSLFCPAQASPPPQTR